MQLLNNLGFPNQDSGLLFKIGDTFKVPVQMESDGTPITITPNMKFTSQIEDVSCNIVSDVNVTPYINQEDYKGFLLLEVVDTSTWKQGDYKLDIKYEIDGEVKHSMDLKFKVIRSITT